MSILDKEKKPIITVKEARKKLGAKYKNIPDKNIELLVKELEQFADIMKPSLINKS